ncbi:MAG: hypothetical protein A3H44_02425 [Gammaproteobacteria bacterium RIFCSPLOWO2_02_FULL_57_10]|nr:MAG: hypothetical protein A3H44_02425 [Gammaproteobacteria bacterium RIFCSPLOWO2_02_FULL_57_10]
MHVLFLAFNRQHVANLGNQPAICRSIQDFNALVHTTQTKTLQAKPVSFHRADWTADQSDLYVFCSHVC